jgi:1A family penicillin-binding protein
MVPDNSRRVLHATLWVVVIASSVAAGMAVQRLSALRDEVESLAGQLRIDAGPESTLLYDAHDGVMSALFEEDRIAVPLAKISPHVLDAVVAVEDKRFWSHGGLDPRRILMAAVNNWRQGDYVQGGSTITQQLVRSLLLSREKNYRRKFKEAVLARRLEEHHRKDEILQAYLNRIYFGDGYYGIEAAALGYFGKSASELDTVEAATLAGLIKAPSLYSPTKSPRRARARRDVVLRVMRAQGVLSDQAYRAAVEVPLTIVTSGARPHEPDSRHARGAEYFRDAVSRELLSRFGPEAVYTGGLRVYTTLDPRLQAAAEEAVAARLRELSRTERNDEPLQSALVAIHPITGSVQAMVGGRDYFESPFNRATEAHRQPGSAFKPFIYAMALESGLSPGSRLDGLDEPIETSEGPWLPSGEHEVSSIRLRDALIVSSNRAAAHVLQNVGVRHALDLVSRFGIRSPMPAVPSLALGTGEVSLLELTAAYGVFANHGRLHEPVMIRRVVDRFGRELYRAPQADRPVVSEATAFLMTSMLADVVNRGTAAGARSAGFKLRAAGKTGTSNDYTDAWFVGYTPHLVTGVWFGYDKPRMIMQRGFAGVIAVPAWARFMTAATEGAADDWFEMPSSVVKVKLCRLSGMLATDRCELPVVETAPFDPEHPDVLAGSTLVREGGVYEELRRAGTEPEVCPLRHGEYDPAVPADYRPPPD